MRTFVIKNLLLRVLILFAIFCMVLCGCGFKGPLYLPKKPVASQPIKSASSPTKVASSPVAIKANSNGVITASPESETLNNKSSIIK